MADVADTDVDPHGSAGAVPPIFSPVAESSCLAQFAAAAAQNIGLAQLTELTDFDAVVEMLLAKLDEYNGLIDVIRGDSNLCMGRTLVEISAKKQELGILFQKVDQLENFVSAVRSQVNLMEVVVADAELQSSQATKVKRLLGSLPDFLINPRDGSAAASNNDSDMPSVSSAESVAINLDASAPVKTQEN